MFCSAMKYNQILLICSHICLHFANCQIFRSTCRRDTLMKATDRESKLVGAPSDILGSFRVETLPDCVVMCTSNNNCRSINFKKNSGKNVQNCEVLGIAKGNHSSSISSVSGWIHYEPVNQIGPRCRKVQCNPGYQCQELCTSDSGYECADIDECLSNPCQNGGTCVNQVNQYSCTCPPFYIEPICETHMGALHEYSTSFDDTEGGKIKFLDRHNVNCASSQIMVRWQIEKSGTKIRYNYQCRQFKSSYCSLETVEGPWEDNGDTDIHFIDRQAIDCGSQGYVSSFKMFTDGFNSRYVYSCCRLSITSWAAAATCMDTSTPWFASPVQLYDMDGLNVVCPDGHGLSYFRVFYRNEYEEVNVSYRCCKFFNP